MIGSVVNYRRGRHTQYEKQAIVYVEGIKTREEAAKLVGYRVVWISPNKFKVFVGVVLGPHGNKGKVRVRFRTGIPGQMIGDIVYVVPKEKIPEIRKVLKDAKDIDDAHRKIKALLGLNA